jgi:crossover junction endodeoxyribonuclease RuvC
VRVLGIDCGSRRTGWGVIESDGVRHSMLAAGVIALGREPAFEQRLLTIARALREIIQQHVPAAAAVEEVFYSANVKTALKLAHVRGVALLVVAEAGLELAEYSPLEIKTSVVGYGRAEKCQVQRMARSLLNLSEPLESEDASDALAVAICHATRRSTSIRLGKTTSSRLSAETAVVEQKDGVFR